jgi:hypothetical protein
MNDFDQIAHKLFRRTGIMLSVEHHLKFISERKEETPCVPVDFIYDEYVKYAGSGITPLSKEAYLRSLANTSYIDLNDNWVIFDKEKLRKYAKSKTKSKSANNVEERLQEQIKQLMAEKERLQNRFDNYVEEMTEVNGELMSKLRNKQTLPIIEEVQDATVSELVEEAMDKLEEKDQGNSSIKGRVAEDVIEEILKGAFENTKRMTGKSHASDFNVDRVMVEVKNYNKTVPINEVKKFHKDISGIRMAIGGLFISIGTKISGTCEESLFAEVVDSRPIIYLVDPIPSMIIVVIDLLQNWDNVKKRNARIEHIRDLTDNSLLSIENTLSTLDKLFS